MPAWKNQLMEKLQKQEGVANRGEHFAASRNKEGYLSMLNNPGEHSAASYFKDTLDTSPSLHLATSVICCKILESRHVHTWGHGVKLVVRVRVGMVTYPECL